MGFMGYNRVGVKYYVYVEMSRELVSVPIITLTGVTSLSNLLLEFPLPTTLPQLLDNKKSLYYHKVLELEGEKLLKLRDKALVTKIMRSLVKTPTSHIVLKDDYALPENSVEYQDDMPELLKEMLRINPRVFPDYKGPPKRSDASIQTDDIGLGAIKKKASTSAAGRRAKKIENSLQKKKPPPITMLQPYVKLMRLSVEEAEVDDNFIKNGEDEEEYPEEEKH